MKDILRVIGAIVFAGFMYCIPVLTACAFCLGWNGFSKLLLVCVSFVQLAGLTQLVELQAEEE